MEKNNTTDNDVKHDIPAKELKEPTPREQIQELESQYNKMMTETTKLQLQLSTYEKDMLACLRKLMPLQNTYLLSVINSLQQQLQEAKNQNQTGSLSGISEPRSNDLTPKRRENNVEVVT